MHDPSIATPSGVKTRPSASENKERIARRWSLTRRVVVGLALLLAPAAQVVQELLEPASSGNTLADVFVTARGAPASFVAATLAGALASLLYAPAFLGLARFARDRSPALAHAGAALGLVGTFGFWGMHVVYLVIASLASSDLDEATLAPALMALENESAVAALVALTFFVGMFGGLLLLLLANWRAGVFPRAPLALALAFLVLDSGLLAALSVRGSALGVALHALLLAGLGWLGVQVLRSAVPETDASSRRGWV